MVQKGVGRRSEKNGIKNIVGGSEEMIGEMKNHRN